MDYFSAQSLRLVKALALQEPASARSVPEVKHMNSDTVKALVDFHEGNYCLPDHDHYGALAHHVMAADILGDDSFVQFISASLQVPPSCIDTSHTSLHVRMMVRDRLRLKSIVPSLQLAPKSQCIACKGDFLDSDRTAYVVCCGRISHCSCLDYVTSCPFCTVAWGGLRCASCGYYTTPKDGRELYRSLKRRRANRTTCCGGDVHFECRKESCICPACGVSPGDKSAETFVRLQRESRRKERLRRAIKKW